MFTTTLLCAVLTFGMDLDDDEPKVGGAYPADGKPGDLPLAPAPEPAVAVNEQWVKVCGRNKPSTKQEEAAELEKELPTKAEKATIDAASVEGASEEEVAAAEKARAAVAARKLEVDAARTARNGPAMDIPASVANQSGLIKNACDRDLMIDDDEGRRPAEFDAAEFKDMDVFPLPNVTPAMLEKVLVWCRHHAKEGVEEIQKPLKSTDLAECGVSPFDVEYVNIEQEELFELILAANYLDIKGLLDLTCAKVASMIKGKSTEQIREQFNIVNDFTPEEEAQVKEENRWCEGAEGSQ